MAKKQKQVGAGVINKIIWVLWLQGWEDAPWLVRKCLASWQLHNPGWDIRALDAHSLQRYIELPDLNGKTIGPAALSDIVRVCLLHEYGGLWVDATVVCHRPLDSWLPDAVGDGFFAFNAPGPGRLLSSWFLAAGEGNPIIAHWYAATLRYWRDHDAVDAYFWFHYMFGELYETVPVVKEGWDRAVKISAHAPHAFQAAGLLLDDDAEVAHLLRDLPPVSKLTYRFDMAAMTRWSLVARLLMPLPEPEIPETRSREDIDRPLASLKVSTLNLGDHIQIIAAQRLIERVALGPALHIDRDNEIASCPSLDPAPEPYPLVINGWFKTNSAEWPPSVRLDPVYAGFHIRLFQCPSLLSEEAIAHYRACGPVGCRDAYTLNLLESRGVDAYLSHCLTLSFPRRATASAEQTEIFVVSRDDKILSWLPPHLADGTFVCHYVDTADFTENMEKAAALLDAYRARARLIVTTLLHCALPAIAMGIPVVMIYPENSEAGHASDCERFSSLGSLIPIYDSRTPDAIDWDPAPVKIGREKLNLIDHFYAAIERWRLPTRFQYPVLAALAVSPPAEDPRESTEGTTWQADELLASMPEDEPEQKLRIGDPGEERFTWSAGKIIAVARSLFSGQRVRGEH